MQFQDDLVRLCDMRICETDVQSVIKSSCFRSTGLARAARLKSFDL